MLHCGNLGFSFRWDLWVAELRDFGKLLSWILGSFYRGTSLFVLQGYISGPFTGGGGGESLVVLQGEGENLWSFYRGESLVV